MSNAERVIVSLLCGIGLMILVITGCTSPNEVEEDPCEIIDVQWTTQPGKYIKVFLCEAPANWPQPGLQLDAPERGGRA